VYGYGTGNSGDISFHVDLQAAPVITVHPQSQAISAGADITLTVGADGTAPLSYQWRFNGVDIPGATDPGLTLTDVQAPDTGDYTVRVSNPVGSAVSSAATLTVNTGPAPPSIGTQPQSQTALVGSNPAFTVVAYGSAPLNYQWRFDGVDIPGATAGTLNLANVQLSQAGAYTVVIVNGLGSITSAVATLTVTLEPITTTLVDMNAVWHYLDTGVDPGPGWANPAFDHTAWSSGPGKLGFKTPGNAGFATVLSYGPDSSNKYVTYYFRKPFDVTSLAGITDLTVDVLRDDGVVLYLNGTEVFRNNLPPAPSHVQLSTNCTDNGSVIQTASIPTSSLVVGVNTLAAEVHQSSVRSSDLVFDARLTMTAVPTPAPIVLSISAAGTSGEAVAFDFTAYAGLGYTVQNTDSLTATNWLIWSQIPSALTNRTITVSDEPPLAPKRFFRVVTPPLP
jgi:hypothetical protein